MGDPLIIEVTDHRGRIRSRTRLDPGAPEMTVGRALRCDVILDDPYADPRHLVIAPTDDGGWRFADLGSVNGVWVGGSALGTRRSALGCRLEGMIAAGVELRIGRSVLRFVSPDAPVPPALFDPAQRAGIARRLFEPRIMIAIFAVAVTVSATTQYFGSTRSVDAADLVTPGLAVMIFTALWAAGWAFTNRLVAQRFRFLAHFAWAVLISTVGSVLIVAREWAGSFVPSVDLGGLDVLIWWSVGALLLVGHFELVSEWSRVKRWVVATAATGVLAIAGVVLSRSAAVGEGTATRRTGALKPVDVRYLPATTLDGFVNDAAGLKAKVDETEADDTTDVRRTPPDSLTATARHPRTSGRAQDEPPSRVRLWLGPDRPSTPRHPQAGGAPGGD